MCDMRTWLDRHNVETSVFSYNEAIGVAATCLEFRMKRQAEAFSAWFADRSIPADSRLEQARVRSQARGMHRPAGRRGLVVGRRRISSSPAASNRRSRAVRETVG
jgi:hypothetical protein